MAEVAQGLGLVRDGERAADLNMREVRRLGAVLQAHGYTKRRERRGKLTPTVWRKCSP